MNKLRRIVRLRSWGFWGGVACGLPAVVLLAVIVAVLAQRAITERSFLIEGETTGLAIEFADATTTWGFARATVCAPLDMPDPSRRPPATEGAGTEPLCDPMGFEDPSSGPQRINWPEGAKLDITLRPDGWLEIVMRDVPGWEDGTVLLADGDTWRAAGLLPFDGFLSLGRDPGAGEQGYLIDGRFEARERFREPFGPATVVVKSGPFARGEVVEARIGAGRGEPAARAPVLGHITATEGDAGPALHVVAITPVGDPHLAVRYSGSRAPRIIRPSWVDSVVASPALLAVALIISFVSSAVALATQSAKLLSGGGDAGARDTSENRGEDDASDGATERAPERRAQGPDSTFEKAERASQS